MITPNDIAVELVQAFGRYAVLEAFRRQVQTVAVQELRVDVELDDEAGSVIAD